jgi:hypothetical protein
MSKATQSLPIEGGLWDQPAYIVQAFEEFETAEGEENERRIENARRNANRQQGSPRQRAERKRR